MAAEFTRRGAAVTDLDLSAAPVARARADNDRSRRFAQKWLRERLEQIRKQVCGPLSSEMTMELEEIER